jgi:hypothetical protein
MRGLGFSANAKLQGIHQKLVPLVSTPVPTARTLGEVGRGGPLHHFNIRSLIAFFGSWSSKLLPTPRSAIHFLKANYLELVMAPGTSWRLIEQF